MIVAESVGPTPEEEHKMELIRCIRNGVVSYKYDRKCLEYGKDERECYLDMSDTILNMY